MQNKRNTGDGNTGDLNTGNLNTGNLNTGNQNTGNWNTGDLNTGNRNTGDLNTGYGNTGYGNTGNRNPGAGNTGDGNTGDGNTGNWNTGNWNTGDGNTGYLNTITPNDILLFNKPFTREKWNKLDKPSLLYFTTTEWIPESKMTDQEKIDNETFHTTGGYLKSYDYKEAFQKSWNEASEEDRGKLIALPNFDADVFFEISGIDLREKESTYDGEIVEINGKKYKLQEV